jgi:polyisoprenoid-binding protein YceI
MTNQTPVAAIRILFLLLFSFTFVFAQDTARIYVIDEGKINFKSDAPLEIIKASSSDIRGLIDFDKQTFAFSVAIVSFEGFNSALQREHFNENYMESDKFPRATFAGRLIEKIDVNQNGVYTVRAKGKLNIHGVEQERIIQGTVMIQGNAIEINSNFSIPLQDHNIAIPKVVQQKIAETIHVEINAKGKRK